MARRMKLFALTIFTGAFLLFQVQPLIAKFILPWFGGTPAVWTTCMLFFQTFLLAGYAYAHLTVRYLTPRKQALLHIALLLAALAFLPVVPRAHWKPGPADEPIGRILLLLPACLGLPYFVLSATSPLLQAWFSRLNPGVTPYRLYALSNAGSLLALVSYPFVFEPALTRQTQASVWAWSFGVFVLLCGACAWRLWRTGLDSLLSTSHVPEEHPTPNIQRPTPNDYPNHGHWKFDVRCWMLDVFRRSMADASVSGNAPPATLNRLLWFLLPLCGSVLLLATTNKLCQDVAVVPFLWVLPLSLYLITFILCFDSPRWYFRKSYNLLLIPMLALLCLALFLAQAMPLPGQIAIYTGGLFVACMVCHGETCRLRPPPRFLTSFYLLIAAGGAAGGILVAVVAPLLFRSYAEMNWGVWLLAALVLLISIREKTVWQIRKRSGRVWPPVLAGVAALGLILSLQVWRAQWNTISISRNFYGVLRVFEFYKDHPSSHAFELKHGDIRHGLQFVNPPMSAQPTAYYHPDSGVGLALRFFPRQTDRRVGLVGLGVGTLAAYGKPGDTFRFYEINPEIKRLAETRFTYLKHSAARVEVVLGDARLSLENEPPQQFDLLVLDAFNGDAIPVHLLTEEAFTIYLRHLKPDGAIAVHISNRHLDLLPVLEGLAARFDLDLTHFGSAPPPNLLWLERAEYVLLSRNRGFLSSLRILAAASEPARNPAAVPLWTDDHASLFRILRRPF